MLFFVKDAPKTKKPHLEMVEAIDILGDGNIFTKGKCMKVFGAQGCPPYDPEISYSREQLTRVTHLFSDVRVMLDYVSLDRISRRMGARLILPYSVWEENRVEPMRFSPRFTLVAWGRYFSGAHVSKSLQEIGLTYRPATCALGLSTLIMSHGDGCHSDLKLKLGAGAFSVALRGSTWHVERVQPHTSIPWVYQITP